MVSAAIFFIVSFICVL